MVDCDSKVLDCEKAKLLYDIIRPQVLFTIKRLAGCTLNDSGAELLAEAITVNQSLSTLELPGTAAHVLADTKP